MTTKSIINYNTKKEVKPIIRWFLRPIDWFVSWYLDTYFEDGNWGGQNQPGPHPTDGSPKVKWFFWF